MSTLATLRQIARLAREDPQAHAGDIAILKLDLFGVDARPTLRSRLAPVRGWLPELDVDALRGLPPHTFGHAYVTFLDTHGLAPLVLSDLIDADTRARNAYGIRYATTHDMFHVLLGFGPDWVGELGVLAFTCGQDYSRTLWVQAALAWLVYPLRTGLALGALWRAWRRGYRLGRQAPFLLGVRLEDRFDTPLDALRAELRLTGEEA